MLRIKTYSWISVSPAICFDFERPASVKHPQIKRYQLSTEYTD